MPQNIFDICYDICLYCTCTYVEWLWKIKTWCMLQIQSKLMAKRTSNKIVCGSCLTSSRLDGKRTISLSTFLSQRAVRLNPVFWSEERILLFFPATDSRLCAHRFTADVAQCDSECGMSLDVRLPPPRLLSNLRRLTSLSSPCHSLSLLRDGSITDT